MASPEGDRNRLVLGATDCAAGDVGAKRSGTGRVGTGGCCGKRASGSRSRGNRPSRGLCTGIAWLFERRGN